MQGSCNDRLRSVLVHSLGKVDTDFRCEVTETTQITPCKNLVSTHCFLFSEARGPSRSSAIIMRATLVSIQRSRRKLTGYTPARCFSGCKLTEHSFDLPFANESRDRQWSLRAYVVQETESGEWHSAGSVGSLYPYRFAAENSDPPLRWKSIVH